ncbi:hypothetical protein CWC22_009775 [Pseudoalteromonas rubra]|uniref:DUF3325 domain-containing protein n=1 Tax=Pseudoalteromonas rubra TaxID=43658 RepID=A0A5S3UWJ5_9GAMM|nr:MULTISPECIES: hypothetical protein [Pseudoalteromonas]QPB83265.1 hypothetical protein CWC22_009775 [Pseudoalteromonas rubra]
MLTSILVFALIAGASVIYLSNKNQRWLKKQISSRWRILAYFLFSAALIGFYSGMSLSVSLFISLMVIMLSLMFIPFLVLMVRDK